MWSVWTISVAYINIHHRKNAIKRTKTREKKEKNLMKTFRSLRNLTRTKREEKRDRKYDDENWNERVPRRFIRFQMLYALQYAHIHEYTHKQPFLLSVSVSRKREKSNSTWYLIGQLNWKNEHESTEQIM